ncbi:cytochrome C biogenesis protein, partial [Clostridium botulinum]|nr:cytochrome C biogenesis protein [Clostridium botulinum]
MEFELFKIETFIPEEYVKKLREALNHIGALTVGGNYDSCMTISRVKGSWRPLGGYTPFNG